MKYYSNNLIKRTEPKIIYNNGNLECTEMSINIRRAKLITISLL